MILIDDYTVYPLVLSLTAISLKYKKYEYFKLIFFVFVGLHFVAFSVDIKKHFDQKKLLEINKKKLSLDNPIDNNPIDNKSIDNKSIDNKPIDNKPIDNKPSKLTKNPVIRKSNKFKKGKPIKIDIGTKIDTRTKIDRGTKPAKIDRGTKPAEIDVHNYNCSPITEKTECEL